MEQSFVLISKNLLRSDVNIFYIITCQLKLIQGLIFGMGDFDSKKVIQNFILIFSFLIQVYEILQLMPFSSYGILMNQMVSTVACLVVSGVMLFYISFDVLNHQEFMFISIIVVPLFVKLAYEKMKRKFEFLVIVSYYVSVFC